MTPLKGAVLILGMHRSGTSCLAGALADCGLAFGTVNRAAPHNAKGNMENRAVMKVNDDLLAASGGSWDRPVRASWSREHRSKRDGALKAYRGFDRFGIKDPRMLFVLDGWLEVLDAPDIVATFRHPMAVARSLENRNGFPIDVGLELWRKYNAELLTLHDRYGFEVIHFRPDISSYSREVTGTVSRLGLELPPEGITFVDRSLMHADSTDDDVGDEAIDQLHRRLLEASRPLEP